MKKVISLSVFAVVLVTVFVLSAGISYCQLSSGQAAPVFSLKDLKGQSHDLAQMKNRQMIILYFFDVDSRPSQEGLLSLNHLSKQYKGDLVVWAVSLSPKEKVSRFVTASNLDVTVLLDQSRVSDQYKARQILPTVAIIGPGLKILDFFQGGGKTTETMLVRLAERQLQRRQVLYAKAVSNEVIKKNPKNVKARAVKGYAALKEGKLKEAEEVFKDLSNKGSDGELIGKEGLAEVYAKGDQKEKALQLATEVEQKDPKRTYAHVIKGDMLYAQGKKKEAGEEYQRAVKAGETEPYRDAVRYNQLGRFYASSGQYKKARELYDHAVEVDPYYIEGTTNKGVTYEKEGRWDKALEAYRQALVLEKTDTFAAVLAKKAQEMLDLQKDAERKKRMDQLIKDLAARYRGQKEIPKEEDTWTSRPMVLTFVDFQEKGGLAERDGFSSVLMSQLSEYLNASGRVKVVDRVLVERLLEELNLGSSELADPETALKLGRVMAAKLIGTGSLFYMPKGTLLSFRLIDSETSAIPQVTTKQLDAETSLERELLRLNREILRTVINKYPLRGFLVKVSGDEAVINLGSKQGVVQGTKFDVLDEPESMTYKGKTLHASAKPVAQGEVVKVEPELSYVKILKHDRPLKADDKVQEKMEEAVSK